MKEIIMGFATHLGPWLLGTVKDTTGTTAGSIRNTGATVVAQSGSLTKATISAANMAVLPAGAQILAIYVDVTEAFDAGTGNTITIKIGSTTIATVGGASTTPIAAGRATVTSAAIATWLNVGSTDAIVTGVYAATGTAATTGIATVTVEYVVKASDGSSYPAAGQQ
jgi:hypothetical protein